MFYFIHNSLVRTHILCDFISTYSLDSRQASVQVHLREKANKVLSNDDCEQKLIRQK